MATRKQYPLAHNKESTQPVQDAEAIASLAADVLPTLREAGDGASANQFARGLYVGTGGNVKVDTLAATAVLFKNVPAGTFLPIWVKKVYSTGNGTTAADIIFLY